MSPARNFPPINYLAKIDPSAEFSGEEYSDEECSDEECSDEEYFDEELS
jgi:hypothetical protein